MSNLPTELLLMIYEFSTIITRLHMNKAFGWSYRFANPFMKYNLIPLYPIHHNIFKRKMNYEIERFMERER